VSPTTQTRPSHLPDWLVAAPPSSLIQSPRGPQLTNPAHVQDVDDQRGAKVPKSDNIRRVRHSEASYETQDLRASAEATLPSCRAFAPARRVLGQSM